MSEPPALRIFIAYRRDDSRDFAGRIHDSLARHFEPGGSVFRDVNDIAPGSDWEKEIDAAIDSCDVFVLLIGEGWLLAGPGFRWWRRLGRSRRINDPEDRHRREIEAAFGREVRTFVVLMEEARMPQRKQLPSESEGLQKVPSIHALQIADHAFDPGVDQLVRGIETAAQQAREARRARELEPKEQREAGKREREQAAKQKRDRDRKRRLLTFAALALGAAVLIVGAALILPADGPELAEVHVGQQPVGVAVEEGKLWVTDREANMVWKINLSPDSEEVKKEYPVGERPDGVAVDSGGTVWVANGGGNAVSMLDPDNGYEDKPIDVGTSQGGIAVDSNNGSVWVALGGSDKVVRLNPDNGYEPESPIDVGDKPYGVTVGEDGSVWVTNRGGSGSVSWIPPDSEDAKTIHVGPNPKGIYATVDAVWVANTADGTVSKIDVQASTRRTIPQPSTRQRSPSASCRVACPSGSTRSGSRSGGTTRWRGSTPKAVTWSRRSTSARAARARRDSSRGPGVFGLQTATTPRSPGSPPDPQPHSAVLPLRAPGHDDPPPRPLRERCAAWGALAAARCRGSSLRPGRQAEICPYSARRARSTIRGW